MYIFRDVKTPGKTQIGLTSLQWGMGSLEISHSGNMGNTIMRSVDPNLENIGFPSIEDLRATFRVIERTTTIVDKVLSEE